MKALLFLAVFATLVFAQMYIEVGGYVYQVVAIISIGNVNITNIWITAPQGYLIAVKEPGGTIYLANPPVQTMPNTEYYIVYSRTIPVGDAIDITTTTTIPVGAAIDITTTTSVIAIGQNCTLPGQLVNITFQGITKIVACASYTDFASGMVITAVWKNSTTLRVEVFNFIKGSVQRTPQNITVKVYDLASGRLVASGSGVDFVEFSIPPSSKLLINATVGGRSYLIVKEPPPRGITTATTGSLPATLLATLVVALALAFTLAFVSEYVGGASAFLIGLVVAAISVLVLPRVGVPEMLAMALAVLALIFSAVAYARSLRE